SGRCVDSVLLYGRTVYMFNALKLSTHFLSPGSNRAIAESRRLGSCDSPRFQPGGYGMIIDLRSVGSAHKIKTTLLEKLWGYWKNSKLNKMINTFFMSFSNMG